MSNSTSDEHPAQTTGVGLSEGDDVSLDDRDESLTVVGTHERRNPTSTYKQQGEDKFRTVIELYADGSEYHLVCTPGSNEPPTLYDEADWDAEKANRFGDSPQYTGDGEAIESIDVLDAE